MDRNKKSKIIMLSELGGVYGKQTVIKAWRKCNLEYRPFDATRFNWTLIVKLIKETEVDK